MKYILTLLTGIILCCGSVKAQNNTGSPYSSFGIGILPENLGPYSAMGGVTAAMRDNRHINFLNPASYTALDSNRFYFQFSMNGEYVNLRSGSEDNNYKVGQNSSLNMALRLTKNLYASFGFLERSDIGYDVLYNEFISGDKDENRFLQLIQGEGGLNEIYVGLGWKYKNLSVGVNVGYEFGKIERRQTLTPILTDSYSIESRDRIQLNGVIFTPGIQYTFKLPENSSLTLGGYMNFKTFLNGEKKFESYKVNSSSGSVVEEVNETIDEGRVIYPLRYTVGANYLIKDKWGIVADYTYQAMSDYKEFNQFKDFNDYHKIAAGTSWTPNRYGRKWGERNTYMVGGYFVRSHIHLYEEDINTYAMTLGANLPFRFRDRELNIGVAADFGIRGPMGNKLIQERFAKIRFNFSIREAWFMKAKIN